MSEKKMVTRNVAAGVGIICVILAACLIGAFAYYVPTVNEKDSLVSSQNSQIMNQQGQIRLDNATINDLNSEILNLQNQIRLDNATINDLNSQIAELENQLASYNSSAITKQLTIYDWWTSDPDATAMNALVSIFQSLYPNVTVIQSPVAGGEGEGYVFKSVIKPLVLAGEAPDAFTVHAGYEMEPYVSGGYFEPINDIWSTNGWESVFPSVLEADVNFNGNYYGVPVDIHRANVMWYNKHILDANGINVSQLTTWSQFFAACQQLSQNTTLTSDPNFSVIALGDMDTLGSAQVLEQIMAGEGIGFYQDFINGKMTNSNNATLLDAITEFATYLNYTNGNHASLTWDEATERVINNQSAFNIMGDWANGEFEQAQKIYGVDYGTFPVPGTSNLYGLVVDCFEYPKGVKDPQNSLNWLTVVGSQQGQLAFNTLEGSIPARTDMMSNPADVAQFSPYQQAAIADFTRTGEITYPSIVYGSAMPESFVTPFATACASFATSARNNDSTTAILNLASELTADITSSQGDFVKMWNLY